jgi:hypothetical protein
MPTVQYLNALRQPLGVDANDKDIAFTDYIIDIKPGIKYQPHPALATNSNGNLLYHHLTKSDLVSINTLSDFSQTGTRELVAQDYVYQI